MMIFIFWRVLTDAFWKDAHSMNRKEIIENALCCIGFCLATFAMFAWAL